MTTISMTTGKPQAQPMMYRGIKFRSKAEGKTAQALDNFGITWQYEPSEYQLPNGLWYKPDFWLPYARMFVECKGEQTELAMAKAYGLVEQTKRPVLIMGYDWAKVFKYLWDVKPSDEPSGFEREIVCYSSSIYLARCLFCGKSWFLAFEDSWKCPCCGKLSGYNTFSELYEIDGITTLFHLGQKQASREYAKYCD